MRDETVFTPAPHFLDQHRRIVVAGVTGSGKTTLARTLAQRLGAPHIELDALHWEPGWTPAPPEVFRQRVAGAVQAGGWAADGNYRAVRDLVWGRATALVWLDYPLWTTLLRLFKRTVRRITTREELWNGNREVFRMHFLSRQSLLLWALQSHPRQRREYPALFREPQYRHLIVVRCCSPAETQRWLDALAPPHR